MQLELLDHQADFLESEHKYTLLLGGIGAGKSFAGAVYTLMASQKYPKAMGAIFANTYKQLTNSTLKCLFDLMMDLGVSFSFNQNKGVLTIGNSKLYCLSLENYEMIRGIEIGYFWGDEISYSKEDAWTVLMGRLRDKKGPLHARLTTTPKGFNWLYDWFEGENKTSEFRTINSATRDNPHLPQSYVDSLFEQFDAKLIEQELEGRFVNIYQGRVYYAFERKNNISVQPLSFIKDQPIIVGTDFNVSPMSGVIAQVINDTIYIIDEIRIESSNTNELAEHIKSKYGTGHKIIPDSTGSARKTSSNGLSDHMILRNAGFTIPNVFNPHRIDRYNCVNSLLEKKRIIIDSKCKSLINDLEKVGYKDGTNLPCTKDKSLTHASDSLGYLCWHLYPLYRGSSSVTVKNYI